MVTRSAASCVAILLAAVAAADPPAAPSEAAPSHAETMARMGLVRHTGGWRTPQEIELIERAERAAAGRREWTRRLEKLRRELDRTGATSRAAEEIAEIADPLAVPSLVAAIAAEQDRRVRGMYVAALSRIPSQDAFAALVSIALDHPDAETRIAAVERLGAIGPRLASPPLVAALASADNAQVNRAAEALARLGDAAAVPALIASLETRHVVVQGSGPPAGATSATFTPSGGGLSMGGGPKAARVPVRNDRVLEALVELTGANFGWDVPAWRAWLARRESPPADYDPRRG
jgi:hypothetical protein